VLKPSLNTDDNTSTAVFEDATAARANADRAMADSSERSNELLDQMAHAAAVIGWKVHRVENAEAATELIASICKEKKATSVLRSKHEVLTQINVDAAITNTGATLRVTEHTGDNNAEMVNQSKTAAFAADIGITGVDYAIAETGTVVLHPRSGHWPVHQAKYGVDSMLVNLTITSPQRTCDSDNRRAVHLCPLRHRHR
jgi:L-lactate utilization protein LutB